MFCIDTLEDLTSEFPGIQWIRMSRKGNQVWERKDSDGTSIWAVVDGATLVVLDITIQ